jgi:hypothetical protein
MTITEYIGCILAPFLPSSPDFTVADMEVADMEKVLSALIVAAFTFLGGYLGGGGGQK